MLKSKWVSGITSTALALSLFAVPVAAVELSEWDSNADAGLDSNEFRSGFETNGLFNQWDTDDDGMLSENEFDAGLGDNSVAYEARFGDEGSFENWDADNDSALSDDEFYDGVYAGYNDDEDNVIEEPEFGDLNDDMGDEGFWDV